MKTTFSQMPKISVNLSRTTMLKDDIVNIYHSIIQKYGIAPEKIEIEITESAIVQNHEQITKTIDELKNIGFIISMDDFGTGYSALYKLQDINIDILKIDGKFIEHIQNSEKGFSLVKNILAMSKDLHLTTVAECIETQEQLDLLQELGCDTGQGYLLAKPMELDLFD